MCVGECFNERRGAKAKTKKTEMTLHVFILTFPCVIFLWEILDRFGSDKQRSAFNV